MSALHSNGIKAVYRRQLSSFLGNPLGYVFILGFVICVGARLFWLDGSSTTYFARNIADLGPLTNDNAMGWALCVLLPALGMGAWAAERDHGTEEHLLTLPLSPLDALLGKWLAIVAFFTIALLCTLSHVAVVAWLGTPDWGMVFANYTGWWLAGVIFAAVALLASTLVSIPAIAFVIGVIGCAAVQACFTIEDWFGFHVTQWYDSFSRGLISLSAIGVAVAVTASAIGAAVFVLSSRRWRPGSQTVVAVQVMSLLFAVVLVVNVARFVSLHGVSADTTAEGLSSISKTSQDTIAQLKNPVTITAFVSNDLPPEVARKGKEVIDMLKAVQNAAPSKVNLKILRPSDALDEAGETARNEFNLKPRPQMVDSASGRRQQDIFLSAAIASGGRTQVIEYFDPGLSVEYEIVRAVRAVSDVKKRVLGVATTDLEITGGFDFRNYSPIPAWEIVEEWKKQYEVRSVSLDNDVAADIEALVVPQPSCLTQAQIEKLHDYIWNGRPTLILEDPLPFFQTYMGRSDLAPSQPKRNPQSQFGQPPQGDSPMKGDLRPLMRSLGIEYNPYDIVWSQFNPSHLLREIPPNFVWLTADHSSIEPADRSAVTTGVNALLIPFPGKLVLASDKPTAMSVTPLLYPAVGSNWGSNTFEELTQSNMMGQLMLRGKNEIRFRMAMDQGNRPPLAVEITGTMASAWPRLAPGTTADKGKEPPKPATGTLSGKSAHVVIISDIDLIDNEFFKFYRDQSNQLNKQDELRALMDLKNIQFIANAVDALMNDKAYLDLRTRRPMRRSLARIEAVNDEAQKNLQKELDNAQGDLQDRIEKANKDFQAMLAKIDARDELDEGTKAQQKSLAQISGQRNLEAQINEMKLKLDKEKHRLESVQNNTLKNYQWWVKFLAVAIPSVVLAIIAIGVFINRLWREQSHIPAARRRQGA
ncbi:MAG: Gldg family protein [Planctomycetota bacterium]